MRTSLCWLISFGLGIAALGQDAPSASPTPLAFQAKFETMLVEATQPFENKRAPLIDGYVNRVTELQATYQKTGDLEKALKAKEEIAYVKKNGTLSDQEFSELAAYRSIYRRESRSIQRLENEAVIRLRQTFVRSLTNYREAQTKAGDLETAAAFANQIKGHEAQIVELQADSGVKPAVKSFRIVSGEDADKILSEFHPRDSDAKRAKAFVSSSWEDRPADVVLRSSRPDSFSRMKQKEGWALAGSTGWVKLTWSRPVKAKTIVLINRPAAASYGDHWVKGQLSANSLQIQEIEKFGRGTVGVVVLEEQIELKELKVEILEGTQHPGLYAIEVYP